MITPKKSGISIDWENGNVFEWNDFQSKLLFTIPGGQWAVFLYPTIIVAAIYFYKRDH